MDLDGQQRLSIADRIQLECGEITRQLLSSGETQENERAQIDPDSWGFPRVPHIADLFCHAAQHLHRHGPTAHAAPPDSHHQSALEQPQTGFKSCRSPGHHAEALNQAEGPLRSADVPSTLGLPHGEPHERMDRGEGGDAGSAATPASSSGQTLQIQTGPLIHRAFLDALRSSRAFRSPHCEGEQAKAFGTQGQLEGLSGSIALPSVSEQQVECLRSALKQRINSAWSSEALRCGVGSAKSGNYPEAFQYYNRAIELHADNADAFVARGAAHANTEQLLSAAADFQHALLLDPGSSNAARYLEVVQQRLPKVAQAMLPAKENPGKVAAGLTGAIAVAGPSSAGRNPDLEAGEIVTADAAEGGHGQALRAGLGSRDRPAESSRREPRDEAPRRGGGKSDSDSPGCSNDSGSSSESQLEGEDVRRALELILRARRAGREEPMKQKKAKRSKKHKSRPSKKKRRK